MRWLLPFLLLTAAFPAVGAEPPERDRRVMLHLTLPLSGGPDRPAWRPARPERGDRFTGREIAKNLTEGWLGIGILAVGGAVWLYHNGSD